jgi:hypothetical protein
MAPGFEGGQDNTAAQLVRVGWFRFVATER